MLRKDYTHQFLEAILIVGFVQDYQWHGDVTLATFSVMDESKALTDKKTEENNTILLYSVPLGQATKLTEILELFKLPYQKEPAEQGRFGFSVSRRHVEACLDQGRGEDAFIYFLSFCIHNVNSVNRLHWITFDPTFGDKLPWIQYHDTRRGHYPVGTSQFSFEGPHRGDFVCRGISSFTVLALIMQYPLENEQARAKKATDVLANFFPAPLQRLTVAYMGSPLPSELTEIVRDRKPDNNNLCNLDREEVKRLTKALPANIFELMYPDIEKRFDLLVEPYKNLCKVFDKLRLLLSDTNKFPSHTVTKASVWSSLFSSASECEHPFARPKSDLYWMVDTHEYTSFAIFRNYLAINEIPDTLKQINNFWKLISQDKQDSYYKNMAAFFCCEAYEKQFGEPFPDVVTVKTLEWVAGQHNLVEEPANRAATKFERP